MANALAAGERSKASSRLRSAASWVGAALFGLVVTELTLVALGLPAAERNFVGLEFDSHLFVPDPVRFWRLHPQAEHLNVNEMGLRGWWPASDKGPREYRIACVGDSCTFGTGVRYEDTYGQRLCQLVQANAPDLSVHCALLALPGYSTHQSRLLLESHLADLDPDLVVFYCGTWNDYLPALRRSDAMWSSKLAREAARPRVARVLRRLVEPGFRDDEIKHLEQSFRDGESPHGPRVPLAEYRDNLQRMAAVASKLGSKVAVVLPPLPAATIAKFPACLDYRAASRAFAADNGIAMFNAACRLREFEAELPASWRDGESGFPVTFVDWAHPSIVGHSIIARGLFAELARVGALPVGTSIATAATTLPDAPAPMLVTSGNNAQLRWPAVTGADGYLLLWAPEPLRGPVSEIDLGDTLQHDRTLWPGASVLVLLQAYNRAGAGPLSAPLHLRIPAGSSEPSSVGAK